MLRLSPPLTPLTSSSAHLRYFMILIAAPLSPFLSPPSLSPLSPPTVPLSRYIMLDFLLDDLFFNNIYYKVYTDQKGGFCRTKFLITVQKVSILTKLTITTILLLLYFSFIALSWNLYYSASGNFFFIKLCRNVPNCAKAWKTKNNLDVLYSLAQFSTVLHALVQFGTILYSLAHTIFNCKILFLLNHSAQFGTV